MNRLTALVDHATWDRQIMVQEVELKSIADFAARLKNLSQVEGNDSGGERR
jgi:hypothetical protein